MSGVRWRKVLTCWNWLYREYSQFPATLDPAGKVPEDATQDGYQMTGIQLGETPCLPDGGTCQGPGQWHRVPLACDHVHLPHTGHWSMDVHSTFAYHDSISQECLWLSGQSLGLSPCQLQEADGDSGETQLELLIDSKSQGSNDSEVGAVFGGRVLEIWDGWQCAGGPQACSTCEMCS